jgi:hypothetical protein
MVGHPIAGRSFFCALGLGLTAAFFLLRAINVYCDPVRWSTEKSAAFTVLSFLNTNKYPPSLLFLLVTLGPTMLFLGAVDARTPQWLRPALVFGRSANVLLSVAHTAPPSTRGHRMLCALRTGALDVRVADSRAVSDHTSARMGILSADRLSGLELSLWSCFIRFAVGLHPRSSAAAMPGSVISELG